MPTNEILHRGWLLKSPPDRRNWFTFSKRTSPVSHKLYLNKV